MVEMNKWEKVNKKGVLPEWHLVKPGIAVIPAKAGIQNLQWW
jgi:hypothetical protein